MQTCARYSVNPGTLHWEAVLRIIRYLKGTAGYGIVYRRSMGNSLNVDETVIPENWSIEENLVNQPEFKLTSISCGLSLYVIVDSNHARDIDTRRSVTAYVFYLGDSPICWKSRLQQCAATSSIQSEYKAVCSTCL